MEHCDRVTGATRHMYGVVALTTPNAKVDIRSNNELLCISLTVQLIYVRDDNNSFGSNAVWKQFLYKCESDFC